MDQVITIFNVTTGLILRTVTVDEDFVDRQAKSGEDYILGEYDWRQYYINPATRAVTARSAIPYQLSASSVPADGATEIVITQLPVTTRLRCGSTAAAVEDGEARLSFTTPGTYRVYLEHEPPLYLPVEFDLEAT
jgi:hypothetical protein